MAFKFEFSHAPSHAELIPAASVWREVDNMKAWFEGSFIISSEVGRITIKKLSRC